MLEVVGEDVAMRRGGGSGGGDLGGVGVDFLVFASFARLIRNFDREISEIDCQFQC